jgi:hypothetical protein
MKNKIKILIVLFAIFSNTTYSQLFATNPFTGTFTWGTNGNVTNFSYNGVPISDIVVNNFTKVNVVTSSSAGNFRASSWSTNPIVDPNKYFEFSLSASPGTTFNMGNITFGIGRSSTGPLKWEWRTSLDNYATTVTNFVTVNTNLTITDGIISVPDSNASWLNNIISFSNAISVENISFRFYGFGAKTNTGTGGFQGSLTFDGESISVIPEPSTVSLLLLCGIAVLGYRIRSKIRS